VPDQIESPRFAAGGNGPNIPDHRPPGVDVRGAHEQAAALAMLRSNGAHQRFIDELVDERGEGLGRGQRVTEIGD
jgi:hypothetical protein